jgi:hypothetical protein
MVRKDDESVEAENGYDADAARYNVSGILAALC